MKTALEKITEDIIFLADKADSPIAKIAYGMAQGGIRWLPTDEEVSDWYSGNIDADCSASSGIYKFRQWLKSRLSEPTQGT